MFPPFLLEWRSIADPTCSVSTKRVVPKTVGAITERTCTQFIKFTHTNEGEHGMERVQDQKITVSVLGGAWPTNIGNSFVNLGSIQSLRMAAPNSVINFVGGFPRWLFGGSR